MSQYHAQADSAAEDAGCEASAPQLVPFLPTIDQSGTWHAALTPSTGLTKCSTMTQLHDQMKFTPSEGTRSNGVQAGGPRSSAHSRVGVESRLPHTCTECSTSFPNNFQLEQHATKNKHKAYLCTCGKAFAKLSALRRHVEESTQARQHKCPYALCDNKFKRPGHVEQHLRLVHQMSKDAIKDLLSRQKLQSRQQPEQASTASAAAPMTAAMNTQAGYSVVNPVGPWTGPIDFSATGPVGQTGSRPGCYPAFSSGLPTSMTGPVTGITPFSAQNFMTQGNRFPSYPVYPAGAIADQTALLAIPAPDFVGYPAAYPNLDLGLFNVDPALASFNPAGGFEMPAPETESMGELFDFDSNAIGF